MVFHTAIKRAQTSEDVKERVNHLIDSITYSVFMYTARGLFERDKLTFIAQVAFQVRNRDRETCITDTDIIMPAYMINLVCMCGNCTK